MQQENNMSKAYISDFDGFENITTQRIKILCTTKSWYPTRVTTD